MRKVGSLPSFIHLSGGTRHDVPALGRLIPEAGALSVMDRISLDVASLRILPLANSSATNRHTSQTWIAVSVSQRIAIVKQRLNLNASRDTV